jgi:hypothetical protein
LQILQRGKQTFEEWLVSSLLLIIERDGLQPVGKKSRLDYSSPYGFKLKTLEDIVFSYEVRGIRILASIWPEDVSVSVLFGVGEDYGAVSDLKADGTRLSDDESQNGASEIAWFTTNRLGFFSEKMLNGGYPRANRVSGDLFYGPT